MTLAGRLVGRLAALNPLDMTSCGRKCQQSSKLTESLILKMHDGPQDSDSKAAPEQFSYPFRISAMLLAHQYLYPEFPGLRAAEFYLSMGGLALYITSRKFLIGPRFAAFRPSFA